jgi:hypothetical protein
MKIIKSQAIKLAKKYKINLDVIDINEWHYGLNVELEHGSKLGTFTNITNNNLFITAKIVIAHLTEFPDYYKRLLKLETQADKYWSSRNKPDIFI